MQLEWNKWLDGITGFRENQGMLWIFGIAILMVMWQKAGKSQQKLLFYSALTGVLIICPVTAVLLLKGYTPFYDWFDLQQLFPLVLLLGFGATELIFRIQKLEVPGLHLKQMVKTVISILCVAVMFLAGTTFHTFDRRAEADESGVPTEAADLLEPLHDMFADKPLVLAAPRDILMYVRLYEIKWQPLYGRDLWDSKAASYINSGYDVEYEYFEFLEKEELSEEEFGQLRDLIIEGPAECVIVPARWITEMEQMTDCVLVNLSDSYTGIIKKDLTRE